MRSTRLRRIRSMHTGTRLKKGWLQLWLLGVGDLHSMSIMRRRKPRRKGRKQKAARSTTTSFESDLYIYIYHVNQALPWCYIYICTQPLYMCWSTWSCTGMCVVASLWSIHLYVRKKLMFVASSSCCCLVHLIMSVAYVCLRSCVIEWVLFLLISMWNNILWHILLGYVGPRRDFYRVFLIKKLI